tara:strand:- start:151 stop:957 length:807 start_codon:yes stop_codon:yes gene_type:complete
MLFRNFIHLTLTLFLSHSAIAVEVMEINFAYIGDTNHPSLLGVKQGIDESNLQGQFLNQRYNLDLVSIDELDTYDFSKYIAVLASLNPQKLTKLAKLLSNTPVFNLTDESDELRLNCIANILHITPSSKMKSDALKQLRVKNPDSNAIPKSWHYSFVKFAARDLNKRFKKNYKKKMNDNSWAGWAAVKMTSDSVARTQKSNPKEILKYLKNELTFDGQKGSDMNFRVTGQLRQLILLVDNDKIVAEAPIRGVAKPPTLDSLGILECTN